MVWETDSALLGSATEGSGSEHQTLVMSTGVICRNLYRDNRDGIRSQADKTQNLLGSGFDSRERADHRCL